MTPERWKRAKALFQAVVEVPQAERAAILASETLDDEALRREVESLLRADSDDESRWLHREVSAAAGLLPLRAGHRIASYAVIESLGQGGMGEVYRASDTKLRRDVALKVLPMLFALDPERLARFRHEAQVLAALNHPNIGAIYGLEEDTEGRTALVLELVEGVTLAERIAVGPMPIGEALPAAQQMADALYAAHSIGIVHRDLKPANVKITTAGVVKVLDFGVAQVAGAPLGLPAPSSEPHPTALAEPADWMIVGTASYMSPEQAAGLPVDLRTDVWAFGCLLFELVTGRKAFHADTVAGTIAAVREGELPLALLPSYTPHGVKQLIAACLQRDRTQRLPNMAQARLELDRVLGRQTRERSRVKVRLAVALAGTLSLVAYQLTRTAAPYPVPPSEWVQLTNLDTAVQPALSPDGRMLAFVRGSNTFTTRGQLYVKPLPDGQPAQITDDSSTKMGPAFSPAGDQIAYTAQEENRWDTWIVPSTGGAPRLWRRNASGLTWLGPGGLLYSEIKGETHMAIMRADASGGGSSDVYVPAPVNAMAHRSYASPNGEWVLVVEMDAAGAWRPCRIVPMDGSSTGRTLGPSTARCTGAAWSPDGQWAYYTANVGDGFHVWRQRFPDGRPEQLTSGPTEEEGLAVATDGRSLITSVGLVQRSVWVRDASGERQISLEGYAYWPLLSADGTLLAYRVSRSMATGQTPSEMWVADVHSGRSRRLFEGQMVTGFDLSRDNRVVAAVAQSDGSTLLWLAWLDRGRPPRPVPGATGDNPRFGPGGEIYFRGPDGNSMALYRVRDDGSAREKVAAMPGSVYGSVSPDGQWLSNYGMGGMYAHSATGASAVRILPGVSRLRWSPDGARLYVSVQHGNAAAFGDGITYVIPLSRGTSLPLVPPGGFESEAALAALPGVETVLHGDFAPGPTPEVYAFSRTIITRNLYRIPVP